MADLLFDSAGHAFSGTEEGGFFGIQLGAAEELVSLTRDLCTAFFGDFLPGLVFGVTGIIVFKFELGNMVGETVWLRCTAGGCGKSINAERLALGIIWRI